MFFKNRKNKDSDSDLKGKCESPTCPTSTTLFLKTELINLDGTFLCPFCYTRKLSEKTVVMSYEEPKTKKVDQIETSRISSAGPAWELNTTSYDNLSRIGPSSDNEKYIEEKNTWKDILLSIGFSAEFSSVKEIIKLSKNPKTRILDTENGKLLVSFATKKEIDLKTSERLLQKEIFSIEIPEITSHNVSTIHNRNKEWIAQNHIFNETEKLEDFLLYTTKLPVGKFFSLEELADNNILLEHKEFLYEFGKYFYFLNFLGCYNFTQISVVQSGLTYLFINSSPNYGEKSFSNVKTALQQIYTTVPFIVDEENSVSFFEGVSEQKANLEKLISNDKEAKEKIFEFFTKHNIMIDKNNPLISIKP